MNYFQNKKKMMSLKLATDEAEGYPCVIENSNGSKLNEYRIYGNTIEAIPTEYQPLEYIKSTKTQYIDTGFLPGNSTSVETCIKSSSIPTIAQYGCVYGSSQSVVARAYEFWVSGNGFTAYGYNQYASGLRFTANTKHKVLQQKNKIYFDDNLVHTHDDGVVFTSPVSMLLFGVNRNGNILKATNTDIYMYYCKVWNNTQLARNMIPCYRKSDGVVGMYDTINDLFLENLGTGTFEKGVEVGIRGLGATSKNRFNVNGTIERVALITTVVDNEIHIQKNASNTPSSLFEFILVVPGEQVNMSFVLKKGSARLSFRMYDSSKTLINDSTVAITGWRYISAYSGYYKDGNTGSFIVPSNVAYIRVQTIAMNTTDDENVYAEYQVEAGNVRTEYRPFRYIDFKNNNVPTVIDLGNKEPLMKYKNLSDYLDFKNKKIVRNIKKYVFDGTENFGVESSYNFYSDIFADSVRNITVLCSHFNGLYTSTISGGVLNTNNIFVSYSGRINIQTDLVPHTVADFKNWVLEQYQAGTPLTIYYQTTVPTEEAIDLPDMNTIVGTNTLTACDDILESSNIYAKYFKN